MSDHTPPPNTASASALDHPLICRRYFFPRAGRPELRDQKLAVEVDGATLLCVRAEHDPAAPWVIYFHGNGEVTDDYVPNLIHDVRAMGCNLFLAEYRGYGGSTGDPALVAQLADLPHLASAIGAPPERVVAFGRSIGALYAVAFIQRYPNTAGLVLESGVADLAERILLRVAPESIGTTRAALIAEATRRFDHEASLAAYHNPLLILHARHDDLVTPRHAHLHHDRAASADRRLVLFDRGDHNSVFYYNRDAYLDHLASFLRDVFVEGA